LQSGSIFDQKMKDRLSRAVPAIRVLAGSLSGDGARIKRCDAVEHSVKNAIGDDLRLAPQQDGESARLDLRLTAVVERYDPRKRFGFLRESNGNRIFFHRDRLSDAETVIRVGSRMTFRLDFDWLRRPVASDISNAE
jgi:cold shock CspA family protein